ncbi:hypothetical protein, partial [Salmonella enterica]|uniref:hypothetical protein n=1 Tax=Salmonella enterica TaxID=28901 RepID=UPI001C7DA355
MLIKEKVKTRGWGDMPVRIKRLKKPEHAPACCLLSMENPQLGWGFRKAFSFKSVIKTPFDLLKHLA